MKIDKDILKELMLANIKQMLSTYNPSMNYHIQCKLDNDKENILIVAKKEEIYNHGFNNKDDMSYGKRNIESLTQSSFWEMFAQSLVSPVMPKNIKQIEEISKDILIDIVKRYEYESDATGNQTEYYVTYITIPIEKIMERILSHSNIKPLEEYKTIFEYIDFDKQKEYQVLINVQLLSNVLPNNNEEVAKPKL